jgi:hypothetical protein
MGSGTVWRSHAHRKWRRGLVLGQEPFCFVVVLSVAGRHKRTEPPMHGLIYLIGLIVVILLILSFFGLR